MVDGFSTLCCSVMCFRVSVFVNALVNVSICKTNIVHFILTKFKVLN